MRLGSWLCVCLALVLWTSLGWALPGGRRALDALADEVQAATDDRSLRPDLSARGNDAWLARLGRYAARLQGVSRAALDPQGKITYDLVGARLQREREHVEGGWLLEDLGATGSVAQTIYDTATAVSRETVADWRWTIKTLRRSDAFVRDYEALLTEGLARGRVQPAAVVESTIEQMKILGGRDRRNDFLALEAELERNLAGHPSLPALRAELHQALFDVVLPAHRHLAGFLERTYLPRAPRRIGEDRARYLHAIEQHLGPGYTPERLSALGEAEVRRLRGELLEAARAVSPGVRSLPAFMRGLAARRDNRYRSPDELLAHAQEEVRIAEKLAHQLAPLPRGRVTVAPVPVAEEATNSGAYADGTFYVNTGKLLDGQRRHEMAALATHETFGGHHLAQLYIDKLDQLPEFRRRASETTLDEGWGLYAEQWRDEQGGFGEIDRIGYLTGQLWRAARLVVDTGLHTGKLTQRQAADYLVQHAFVQRSLAEVEVERYVNRPGQALAYYTGKQKLLQIREAARARLGEHYDERAFHARLLRLGVVPLGVADRAMQQWANRRLGQRARGR